MIIFWILAATMMAVAVALILPPLLGHSRHATVSREAVNLAIFNERLAALEQEEADPSQRDRIRHEMERELIQDVAEDETAFRSGHRGSRMAAIAIVVSIPALSALVYAKLGSQDALQASPPSPAVAGNQSLPADHPAVGAQPGTPSLAQMVEKLAARLNQEPADLQGWTMLGRSYMVMERYAEARDAFARAYAMSPDDPELVSRYAEATALARGGDLSGKASELVDRLLELAPDHPNGLWLAGLAAYQRQDYPQAVDRWSRLAAMVGTGPNSDAVAEYLAKARARLGDTSPATTASARPTQSPVAASTSPSSSSAPITPSRSLSVRVSLAPELADKASPGDTVFIFARAAEGPRMPLAIVQRTVAELPVSVTLDDSMAMTPTMKLSNFPEVVVGARVSKSGNAMPQAGDLEGSSPPMSESASGAINVTIDRVI